MTKFTHSENRSALLTITSQAIEAGLLKSNQRLSYETGNSSYAVPTRIRIEELNDRWEYVSGQAWVPEFTYKDGPTYVGRALTVLSNTLWSINMNKQEAARRTQ